MMFLVVLFAACLIASIPTTNGACSVYRPERELRGAWIATVSNIDWPKSRSLSTNQNQADLLTLLDSLENAGINVIVFHVRPVGDAFYQSKIEPWSAYLTGTQGKPPNPLWDPLSFIIEECHKRNMELHAWINPYRASATTSTSGLAPNNMALAFPRAAHVYSKSIWMDPGSSEVKARVIDVVKDIVTRYDVDAMHIDDYFYPYPTKEEFPDDAFYQNYTSHGGRMSRDDWRRSNVNTLVEALSKGIKALKPHVKFGISPFGIWKAHHPPQIKGLSSYDEIYADSRLWLQKGWVDYLAPQLYWAIDPPAQSFTALADWWSNSTQNPMARHLYPGMADYRIVAHTNPWNPKEIIRQIMELQARRQRLCLGGIHFSATEIEENSSGLTSELVATVYGSQALVPRMSWLVDPKLAVPLRPKVKVIGVKLDWSGSDKTSVRSWAVYESSRGYCKLEKVLSRNITSLFVAPGPYFVSAVDRLGREVDGPEVIVHDAIVS